MECYEGATMIKTFRGLMADEAIDTIVLHTNDGSMGYRIVKFQMIGAEPGVKNTESTMKIYKVSQTTADSAIDFSDNTLLAAGYWAGKDQAANTDTVGPIIFDQEVFNQDIYITHHDAATGEACNYYLELEQVKLDLGDNTVATLKDIRNKARRLLTT
jgi:hypothetical protein